MSRHRDTLADHMAAIHYHANMMRKIMTGWRVAAGSTWKLATEKRIKKEAEKCISDMSLKYESQIQLVSLFVVFVYLYRVTTSDTQQN